MSRVRRVSVVIPAWNAAATIEQTLESLRAQTFHDWEAVVVDDGSTDRTAEVVAAVAEHEPRIRLVRQPSSGAGEARNRGLAEVSHPWLLFLDSDDWIRPEHLERLSTLLATSPDADAAVCGWTLMRDGIEIESEYCHGAGDLFPILARRPAFAIHTCVVSRNVVNAVGGFDPHFRVHQDWVLWQRIARMGANFAVIRDPLAIYRLHETSLTANQTRLAAEALEVISLGHRDDPMVHRPAAEHAAGRPAHELTDAQVTHLAWPAGIELARGADARPLFDGVAGTALGAAEHVGTILARAAVTVSTPDALTGADQWPALTRRLADLLETIARATGDATLPRTVRLDFERRLLDAVPAGPTPSLIGSVAVEITTPLGDLVAPDGIERLRITALMEGERLGVVELPVISGRIRSAVVADAIADAFAWAVLGRFFANTIYSTWTMKRAKEGWEARRGLHRMCAGLPDDPSARIGELHDRVGWTVFLEEIWHPAASTHWWGRIVGRRRGHVRDAASGIVAVEVSEPIPEEAHGAALTLLVGGAAVAMADTHATTMRGDLRTHLTDAAGFELCRVAVREVLLGQALKGKPLRERLARAAERRNELRTQSGEWNRVGEPDEDLAPGARGALGLLTVHGVHAALCRHEHGAPDSSASRTADLPAESYDALRQLASATGTLLVERAGATPRDMPRAIAYAPEVIAVPRRSAVRTDSLSIRPPDTAAGAATPYGRHHFERLFASGADPWSYDTPYERLKYEQTLSMIGQSRVGRALEVGCAEGHFTTRLASRAAQVIAADISDIALGRVQARCAAHGIENVVTRRLDLARDPLPDGCDLVVCSEMLYYMGDRLALADVGRKMAAALAPNGVLVTAHANVLADAPNETGFDWGVPYGAKTISETLASVRELALEHEIRTPLYRIQRFRRLTSEASPPRPVIQELPNEILPTGLTATGIRWGGASAPMPAWTTITTARLPILMYHRIAAQTIAERERYTVHPERFAAQLQYLRDGGFRSATVEQWRAAVVARRPLAGRRVMITFDDAYEDFATAAWPLLEQFGFDAQLFVITGRVGMTNNWDPAGRNEPLLDWDALQWLAGEGVQMGSHTESHPRLTSCSASKIVDQLASSRATMAERLGRNPVSIAYPWGGEDAVVHHLAGACGYTSGFTCRYGAATRKDAMMALPRIEVPGGISFGSFVQLFDS